MFVFSSKGALLVSNYKEGPDHRSVNRSVNSTAELKGYLKIGGSRVYVFPLLNCHTMVSCLVHELQRKAFFTT